MPKSKDPLEMGTVTDAPMSVDLTCAGISSGPSIVCRKNSLFHDSGTILLIAPSMSVRTSVSAFSFNDKLADVCLMNRCAVPITNWPSSGIYRVTCI